jgi:SnoaL-like domain
MSETIRHGETVGQGGDLDAGIARALQTACARYAIGLDTRDAELFLSAFTPAARMSVEAEPDGPVASSVRQGHRQLAELPTGLRRFTRTHHMLGQHHFWLGANGPEGSVYCTARHLTRGPAGSTDLAMFIRYLDCYAQAADGRWLIASRRVVIDWTELNEVR